MGVWRLAKKSAVRNEKVPRAAEVKGDGVMEYISMIVMNNHPKLSEISEAFDNIVKMFNDNK